MSGGDLTRVDPPQCFWVNEVPAASIFWLVCLSSMIANTYELDVINCLLQVIHGENTKALGDVAWEGNLDGGLVATISCLEEWTLDELDGGNFAV